jgi:hypothetical protein
MKIRTCDKCKNEIKPQTMYVKMVKQSWSGRVMKQYHFGDLCMECAVEVKG